jgi:hypothetical protein
VKLKRKAGQPVWVPSWPAIDNNADSDEPIGSWGLIDGAWIEAEVGAIRKHRR